MQEQNPSITKIGLLSNLTFYKKLQPQKFIPICIPSKSNTLHWKFKHFFMQEKNRSVLTLPMYSLHLNPENIKKYNLKKFFPICIPSESVIFFIISCAWHILHPFPLNRAGTVMRGRFLTPCKRSSVISPTL